METKPRSTKEWERIITSKQIQAFAGKIEIVHSMTGEARDLVKSLVRFWASLSSVRRYFPDLEDIFTPDAIFCIEYAFRAEVQDGEDGLWGGHENAYKVRCILSYILRIVANNEARVEHVKHLYNNRVKMYRAEDILTILEVSHHSNGRSNPHLYIPKDMPEKKTRTRRVPRQELIEAMSEPWTELRDDYQRFIQREGGAL